MILNQESRRKCLKSCKMSMGKKWSHCLIILATRFPLKKDCIKLIAFSVYCVGNSPLFLGFGPSTASTCLFQKPQTVTNDDDPTPMQK